MHICAIILQHKPNVFDTCTVHFQHIGKESENSELHYKTVE